VRGLLKNATEGIARGWMLVTFTVLLAGAAVLPAVSLVVAVWRGWPSLAIGLLGIATALGYWPRLVAARRFQQSWLGAALHPLGVALFLVLQWLAWGMETCGLRVSWRGRG
jgi:hypothetical protein